MSHMMSIKRTISKTDLLKAIQGDTEFSVLAEGDAFLVLRWSDGQENAVFNLVKGEVTVGTPTVQIMAKMKDLAGKCHAEIVGKDEELDTQEEGSGGLISNRSTWIGWPILVVVLLTLLIIKW